MRGVHHGCSHWLRLRLRLAAWSTVSQSGDLEKWLGTGMAFLSGVPERGTGLTSGRSDLGRHA